jgi:nicotinate dehydrogenase subunit B
MRTASDRRNVRRQFLARSGALVVAFALSPRTVLSQQPATPALGGASPTPLGSLKDTTALDAWIRVDADGSVTVFTGKVEFGQGIKTALMQLAAEELVVDMRHVKLITADTDLTPNEGYTSGSHSMQDSGTAIMNAAAQVREMLLAMAATRLSAAPDALTVADGVVHAQDGRSVAYGELVAAVPTHASAQPVSKLRAVDQRTLVGKKVLRVDIPGKVAGGASYVQDLRLPHMLHARVVRPPSYGARLTNLDAAAIEKMPGVVKVVRNGSFVAVVAQREFQAIQAMRALGRAATWQETASKAQADIYAQVAALPHDDYVIRDVGAAVASWTLQAIYRRPYQMHGAIGPSCAVARFDDGKLTVWTHSQGVYPLRAAIAEMVRMPVANVRCVHSEGSGCYGHNAADDAAADAALIAIAVPSRPIRVQWMREQEHTWEPYGPAMLTGVKGALDETGAVIGWQYEVWSGTHSTRPGRAGNLAAAWSLQDPFSMQKPQPIPQPEGGGDRNALPLYTFPNQRVVHHFIPEMPLRVSALRSLGAYMNVFSIESFVDELARSANADSVAFRLRHLQDARAQEVIRMAAERFGWSSYDKQIGRGRGFAFARYKNLGAYAAIAIDVRVDHESGRIDVERVTAAVDSGDAVNPDGIRNQIEGGILQALSWTLYESVSFNEQRITSRDWSGYPIMRFSSVPKTVDVHVITRIGAPFLGTGEAAQGPSAAALANAVADATGVRMRELPLTRERVKAAIGV